jgi:broad specificity phosphatase PhoE
VEAGAALGEAPGLPVHDRGDPWVGAAWLGGRAAALVDRLVRAHPEGRLVVCSHGDVIPALLAVLAGRDGLALDDVHLHKGARVTLRFDGARCVGADRKGPP